MRHHYAIPGRLFWPSAKGTLRHHKSRAAARANLSKHARRNQARIARRIT